MVLAVFTRDQSELIPYDLMSLMKGTFWIDMLKLNERYFSTLWYNDCLAQFQVKKNSIELNDFDLYGYSKSNTVLIH